MATPRVKRSFAGAASEESQRQITSYFQKATSQYSPSPQLKEDASQWAPPGLPDDVRSNLINVGMRVRKAMNSGSYKTGSAYGSVKLWSGTDASSPLPSPPGQYIHPPHNDDKATKSDLSSSARHLAPFCGIHKIGGLSAQPGYDDVPSLDDVPPLTCSQETASSTDNNRKRHADDHDDDNEVVTWNAKDSIDCGKVSPRSLVPAAMWGGNMHTRVMAVPGTIRLNRRAATGQQQQGQIRANDHDFDDKANWLGGRGSDLVVAKVAMADAAGNGADFEEASFLVAANMGVDDMQMESGVQSMRSR